MQHYRFISQPIDVATIGYISPSAEHQDARVHVFPADEALPSGSVWWRKGKPIADPKWPDGPDNPAAFLVGRTFGSDVELAACLAAHGYKVGITHNTGSVRVVGETRQQRVPLYD